jgi:hypothetical protein
VLPADLELLSLAKTRVDGDRDHRPFLLADRLAQERLFLAGQEADSCVVLLAKPHHSYRMESALPYAIATLKTRFRNARARLIVAGLYLAHALRHPVFDVTWHDLASRSAWKRTSS